VGGLIPEVAVLGLAVAFTSPTSVVTVIVLLSMSHGVRRAVAFVCGWILGIAVLGVLLVSVLNGQDFSSTQTTPSRTFSAIEVVLGCLLLVTALRLYRRPRKQKESEATPGWLDRIDRTNWLLSIAVGAVMLSYALTLAAGAEILKANVSTSEAALAYLVFALMSIVTIAAPVVVVVIAPDRSEKVLADWKEWLLGHSRSIALIAGMVIGVFLIVRGAHDLIT
jgi:threonine/homoserine/homoserine lactone efflux protein